VRELPECLACPYACVVDQDVDAAHPPVCRGDHVLGFSLAHEVVYAPGGIRSAGLPAGRRGFLELCFGPVGREVDCGAFGSEPHRHRLPDPARGPCDQCNLSV
jgi:hypothetical protein